MEHSSAHGKGAHVQMKISEEPESGDDNEEVDSSSGRGTLVRRTSAPHLKVRQSDGVMHDEAAASVSMYEPIIEKIYKTDQFAELPVKKQLDSVEEKEKELMLLMSHWQVPASQPPPQTRQTDRSVTDPYERRHPPAVESAERKETVAELGKKSDAEPSNAPSQSESVVQVVVAETSLNKEAAPPAMDPARNVRSEVINAAVGSASSSDQESTPKTSITEKETVSDDERVHPSNSQQRDIGTSTPSASAPPIAASASAQLSPPLPKGTPLPVGHIPSSPNVKGASHPSSPRGVKGLRPPSSSLSSSLLLPAASSSSSSSSPFVTSSVVVSMTSSSSHISAGASCRPESEIVHHSGVPSSVKGGGVSMRRKSTFATSCSVEERLQVIQMTF